MLSTFSGLPRTAWVIFAGTVVNRLGYLVAPFLVFYLGARGIPSLRCRSFWARWVPAT